MANVRTPRDAWVEAALQTLGESGLDAVRVETLAARLGVTKGGFYWHFTDRAALLEEMLASWETAMVDDVIARVEEQEGDARARLRHLFRLAPSADFEVELAIREWARRDPAIAARLHRVDRRRMQWLRSLFGQFCVDDDDTEARSMLAYSLLIGGYFIAAQHGRRSRTQILRLALERLLSDDWGATRYPRGARRRTVVDTEPEAQGAPRPHPASPRPQERDMAGKNKGGREIRKPKQPKKAKESPVGSSIVPPAGRRPGK